MGVLCVLVCLQVLSVQTALSIQSHPDKKLAEKLHAQQPKVRTCGVQQQPS
jgi:mannose-6-phosphate isomerase class I